jgi:SAM-dependent methyltransferase
MDAVLDIDWAAHWRGLVEAREAQHGPSEAGDWWAPRASSYARQVAARSDDWFLPFLEPWLRPTATLLDVGAGTGRYATPLARRLEWVTAVEPSQAMRSMIPPADNMTIIGSTWQDAEPAPADLVICIHVLYPIADALPFLEKLQRSARERVFVVLRDSPHTHPAEVLARGRHGREPWLRDCLMLLRQMGVRPELSMVTYESTSFRFDSVDAAADLCRRHLGTSWDEAPGRAWLEANLRPDDEDGMLVYQGGAVTGGVLHWKPES